jgi:DnaJ homolog subfamily C member 25
MEEDLDNELELQIQGVEKPTAWKLLGVQFLLLPYSVGKVSNSLLVISFKS